MQIRLLGAVAGILLCSSVWAGIADDMKALIERGKAADAYELGKAHPEELGDPEFDFYFGVAAVGSGRSGEGVFALERYVINAPENAYGRLELARGYFVLGEDARAREQFLLVLDANPTVEIRASVERFLDALRSREAFYRPANGFYVEAGIGHDSNVNAGVASGSSFRIFGADLPVPDTAVRQHDSFYTIAAGANGSIPLRPGLILFGGANADVRNYDSARQFSQQSVRIEGGLSLIRGGDLWRGSLSWSNLALDSDSYRDVLTFSGEWHHQLDELRSINALVQWSDLSYAGTNSQLNSHFPVIGVGYRQAFVSPMQPLLGITVYVGNEDVRERDDRTRDIYGLRVTGSLTPAPRWSVLAGVTLQQNDYKSPDPFRMLDFERRDFYSSFDLTVSYALTRNLSLRTEALISRNSSNDSLFEYDRDSLTVKLRYDFK